MKISIFTTSYNHERYIEQTIQSVLSQQVKNLEYIVIDDGSSDNSVKIIQKYDKKLQLITQKNTGQVVTMNRGLTSTTGDIIGFINSDDILLPGALKKVVKFFEDNPKAMWVTGDYFIINDINEEIHKYIPLYKKILRLFPTFNMLCFANFIPQPSTFWKREILDTVGLFNEKLLYTMDYDYWLRIINKYPLYVINSQISGFRTHSLSKGGSQYVAQLDEEIITVKKYTKNNILLLLHTLHNSIIKNIYKVIKNQFFLSTFRRREENSKCE